MGVSTRHTRRILAAYREEGAAALAHGHRGRRASNATPEPLRSEVLRLARSRYTETNHTHLGELLREREGMEIGRTTLRRILVGAGLKSPRRRRPPRHRIRRQRMPREGMLMLIQVDGSHHRWLRDDVPPIALLLAVDDATGIVVNALFCEQENTRNYFLLMRGLIQRHGIPIALYTDRHSVFKNVPGSGLPRAPTQFNRAMDELGIQMVFALSPQAKGRVERTAGTFQDRLVTEFRLSGATTIEEANVVLKEFLDRFNGRFGVPAQHPEAAYRPLEPDACLDRPLLQAQAQGGQGQHGDVPPAYPAAAAGHGTTQLCGSGGGGPRRLGRSAGCALPGRDRPQPGGAAPSRHAQKLQRLLPHTGHPYMAVSTVWAGAGMWPWQHSTRRWTPPMLATRPSTTALSQFERPPPRHVGSPLHSRRRSGTLYRRAKRRGLSIRAVAREVGIHRDTAKKYMEADNPPLYPDRVR